MSSQDAGAYAQRRYETGIRNYRRRMRPYFIGFGLAACTCWAVAAIVHELDWWSYAVGMASGCFLSLAIWIHDEPPQFIAKWARGAEGERKTASVIAPLLMDGWKIRHDIEIGRGNVDHLLLDPSGTGYLLESKALAGEISVDGGTLTCRYADDPDEVRRYSLQERMSALVDRVRAEWSRRTGRAAPELRAVVVLWGSFRQRQVESGGVTYVAGDDLLSWLKS
jgi:hypothetical protein